MLLASTTPVTTLVTTARPIAIHASFTLAPAPHARLASRTTPLITLVNAHRPSTSRLAESALAALQIALRARTQQVHVPLALPPSVLTLLPASVAARSTLKPWSLVSVYN